MVCRSSAIAPICITPNILNIAAEEFGEQQPGAKTLGFLGLLSLKVFHANNETLTNQYASDQIGKVYAYLEGWNAGNSQQHHHTGVSANKQLVHIIEPIEFTALLRPDRENPYSEAVVYLNGRTFIATQTKSNPHGLPYIRVHFSR